MSDLIKVNAVILEKQRRSSKQKRPAELAQMKWAHMAQKSAFCSACFTPKVPE
jgi:hypothetical protein